MALANILCAQNAEPPVAEAPASTATKSTTAKSITANSKSAQPGAGEVEPQEVRLATELEVATQQMREHLKKMRSLAIEYHLTDGPGEAKPLSRQWIKLLDTGRKIHQQMVEAAMNDYRADPKPDSKTAAFLYDVAARNADADRFDGMLEVVKLLKENGFTEKTFDLCFGLTAAAANEFELAKPHLEIAAKNIEQAAFDLQERKGITDEQRQASAKNLFESFGLLTDLADTERYAALWAAELKAREADAAGPPLPRVAIETTKGTFEVELFENQAPNTVANFISLCEKGFYDGLPFHRVLTHFMAQGGCPNRDGSGGPGYSIRTELDGTHDRNFFRGTLGMAMSEQPDSGGSQFYVCYLPRAHLNGKYVAFGRVVSGMNVISDFTHINPDEKKQEGEVHDPPDEIVSTKVLSKRPHPYQPETIPAVK